MQEHGAGESVGDRRVDHVLVDGDLAAREGEIERLQRGKTGEGILGGAYVSDVDRTKGASELSHVTVTRTLDSIEPTCATCVSRGPG